MEALVVIGGSTASGKSALALALARRLGGLVVNADSQQLFHDLPILTARPGPEDTDSVPHRLYGLLAADEQPSVARWLTLLDPVLAEARRERRPVITVGGTGLYLHALLHGLPPMPDIDPVLRADLRAWSATASTRELRERLGARDPEMAARLRPGDRQRLLRALEVIEATGRSLLHWQSVPRRAMPLPPLVRGMALLPPADAVRTRIEGRLAGMIEAGAMAEVADLLAVRPDAVSLPIAKVHGMRELAAVVTGGMELPAAVASIAAQIRGYARRQRTWFRHQLPQLTQCPHCGETSAALGAAMAEIRRRP